MAKLTSEERLLRTLTGEPIDRPAIFDVIHNIDLIEHLTGEKVSPNSAEDLFCKGVSMVLDIVRHFAVPNAPTWTFEDENGFVYNYEWWTGHIVSRPSFTSSEEIADSVKRDTDIIRDCIEKRKICHLARQHVRLFDENYTTFAEVKAEYKRLSEKMDDTLILAPEDVAAIAVAAERYDEPGWWYLYNDCPETARQYLDTLTDYQLSFIDAFADSTVCPFAQISIPTGTTTGLLYPPEFVQNEIIPREKKKVERWKQHGYHVFCFLDGYKWPVIDDYLDIGVEEIHPCETYCGMDVKTFREKYPEVVLGQPIDCVHLMTHGSPEQIRQAVARAIEDADGKKLILGSTSVIHRDVPVENALALFEAAGN